MFRLTEKWLRKYYGSKGNQIEQTREWLLRYGKDVPETSLDLWSEFKHLSEYQVNTPLIVEEALSRLDTPFKTELEAHLFINRLRVPNASAAYLKSLQMVNPKSILELGVGGDSAISTAVFLRHAEKVGGYVDSVDHNPLGMTWERYKDVNFWSFQMADSVDVLDRIVAHSDFYDMVFIDTIHSFEHTWKELERASQITLNLLMDDATFEGNEFDEQPGGVKRAIDEWLSNNPSWQRYDFASGSVSLLKEAK